MLMSRGVAPIFQVLISGIVFGLAHTSWTLLAKRDFKFAIPAILSTSVLGISSGYHLSRGRAQLRTLYLCARNNKYCYRTVADVVCSFR